MKHGILILVGLLIVFDLSSCAQGSQNNPVVDPDLTLYLSDPSDPGFDIDGFIEAEMEKERIPGLAAAVIVGGELVWAKGYGVRNIETQMPVSTDTPFRIASVNKLLTGTALVQAWETGSFAWEDDINKYLPFKVENPLSPNSPITPLSLATHTSGIIENWEVFQCSLYYFDENGVPTSLENWVKEDAVCPPVTPMSLDHFLEAYLVPEGELYDANLNFTQPGEFSYTNVGTALAGYLVEIVTKTPLDVYIHEHIFEPLGMENSSYDLTDFDLDEIACPHIPEGDQIIPMPHYTYSAWPAGAFWSTVEDLAKYLIAIMDDGEYEGGHILESDSVKDMLTTRIDDHQAIFWHHDWLRWDNAIYAVKGHVGANYGVSTMMFFEPGVDTGVIVLANLQERSRKAGTMKIMLTLFEHSYALASLSIEGVQPTDQSKQR